MKASRPPTSPYVFWSTVAAILLGTMSGVGILTLMHKNPASALTQALPKIAQFNFSGSNSAIKNLPILPRLNRQMTLLIMGVDSNGKNTDRFANTRSDTMIVVSLDPITQKVGAVSIPRDSRVKIANSQRFEKINAAHAFGGPELAIATVNETFGVNIDHYVVVDTFGLKQLCRLLGPMEVLVEKEMHYHDHTAKLNVDLQPGLQILNADQLEEYVRFRHDAKGDIGRIERQQWFLRQALRKLTDPQIVFMLPELIKLSHDYVQTNLSCEDMASIATFVKDIPRDHVFTSTLPGTPQMIGGGSYWVPDLEASQSVFNRIILGRTDNVETTSKPISVAIKFAKGSETKADQLEQALTNMGYKVRYKWVTDKDECQHQEICLNSSRADDTKTHELKTNLPDLSEWPVVLDLSTKPLVDLTLVISPNTNLLLTASTAASTENSKNQ